MARTILMGVLLAWICACRPAVPDRDRPVPAPAPADAVRPAQSALPAPSAPLSADVVPDQPVEVRDAQGRVILSLERVEGELRRVERTYDEQGNLLRTVTPAAAVTGPP